jgi:hypothetical protein
MRHPSRPGRIRTDARSFHLGVAILEQGIAEKGLRQVDHAPDTNRARDHLAALGA